MIKWSATWALLSHLKTKGTKTNNKFPYELNKMTYAKYKLLHPT